MENNNLFFLITSLKFKSGVEEIRGEPNSSLEHLLRLINIYNQSPNFFSSSFKLWETVM